MANFREHSKNHNWTSDSSTEHINAGSLQRIADATERMADNYIQLQNERDRYISYYRNERDENNRLRKSNAALRGHIKRLKNKS